jgi:hypothetical protein
MLSIPQITTFVHATSTGNLPSFVQPPTLRPQSASFWSIDLDAVRSTLLESPTKEPNRRWRIFPHLHTAANTNLATTLVSLVNTGSIFTFDAQQYQVELLKRDFGHLRRISALQYASPHNRYWLVDEHSLETLCGCNELLLRQLVFQLTGFDTMVQVSFVPQSAPSPNPFACVQNNEQPSIPTISSKSSVSVPNPVEIPKVERSPTGSQSPRQDNPSTRQDPPLEPHSEQRPFASERDEVTEEPVVKFEIRGLDRSHGKRSLKFLKLFKKFYPTQCWHCMIDHRGRACAYYNTLCENCLEKGHATFACEELLLKRLERRDKRQNPHGNRNKL